MRAVHCIKKDDNELILILDKITYFEPIDAKSPAYHCKVHLVGGDILELKAAEYDHLKSLINYRISTKVSATTP